jgi:transposase-like protein
LRELISRSKGVLRSSSFSCIQPSEATCFLTKRCEEIAVSDDQTHTIKGEVMKKPRTFTAEFKAQVVLEELAGTKSVAEICRHHNLSSSVLYRWKTEFLEHAARVFQQDQQRNEEQERIAELERLVGRLTLELDIAKKASLFSQGPFNRNGT